MTCSIGWAPFPWSDLDPRALTSEQVLNLADQALYRAKQDGRNRACGVRPSPDSRISLAETGLEGLAMIPLTTLGPPAPGTESA